MKNFPEPSPKNIYKFLLLSTDRNPKQYFAVMNVKKKAAYFSKCLTKTILKWWLHYQKSCQFIFFWSMNEPIVTALFVTVSNGKILSYTQTQFYDVLLCLEIDLRRFNGTFVCLALMSNGNHTFSEVLFALSSVAEQLYYDFCCTDSLHLIKQKIAGRIPASLLDTFFTSDWTRIGFLWDNKGFFFSNCNTKVVAATFSHDRSGRPRRGFTQSPITTTLSHNGQFRLIVQVVKCSLTTHHSRSKCCEQLSNDPCPCWSE